MRVTTPRALLLVVAACCALGAACRAPEAAPARAARTIEVQDAAGRQVRVAVPARRVIAFNAFNVELVRALGAFDAIVGMDEGSAGGDYAGYWGGFDTAHTVGRSQAEPNWEQIVDLAPDVVIFPRNGAWEDAVRMLTPFGIPVLVLTGWDLDQHELTVSVLGRLLDRPSEAERLLAFYRTQRAALQSRLEGVRRKRVFLENQRDYSSPIPGSGWHDMIEMAGGTNIFADLTLAAGDRSGGSVHDFAVDPEAILSRAPDAIVKLTGGGYALESGDRRAAVADALRQRPGWDRLAAVRAGQVWVTSSFPMNACTKIVGALYLASWLYPERMAGLDPDAVMKEWIEGFQHVPLPAPERYRLPWAARSSTD